MEKKTKVSRKIVKEKNPQKNHLKINRFSICLNLQLPFFHKGTLAGWLQSHTHNS